MNTSLLNATQNRTIVLITKETKSTDEQLIEVVSNTEHFTNWLCKQPYPVQEINDSTNDFLSYGKHTFENGDTIRIKTYQLNTFEGD